MKVFAPPTLAELQHLVRQLHGDAAPWLPSGLGSRLDWGPAVTPRSAVVSLRQINGIREHNPGDFTLTVAAGTPLQDVQAALSEQQQWLSLDAPWGAAETSIGGLIARGLAGGYRQRALGVRDQLLGIQLLRSDAVLARAGGKVVKNVAGYDLMRLLTGSWGSLALITEVTLRTQPQPPQRRVLIIQDERQALQTLSHWLRDSSLSPERLDLWSAPLAAAAGLKAQPLLLLSLASIDATTLEEQIACITERAPGLRVLDEPAATALLAAERGIDQQGAGVPSDWLLRLAVPPAQSCLLLDAPELKGVPLWLAAGSGIGDAWASSAELPRYRVEALRHRAQELGGYVTVLRQPTPTPGTDPLPSWLDAPARPLIEAVKRQFDPSQQLARGRLPGVAA